MEQYQYSETAFVKLPDTFKNNTHAQHIGAADLNEIINVTVRLRRKNPIDDQLIYTGKILTHELYALEFGAADEDIRKVEEFAHNFHLTVLECHKAKRLVMLRGKVMDFQKAFQVHLAHYRHETGTEFRGRVGHIHIPQCLVSIIEGVFGLDNRPHAKPMFHYARQHGRFAFHSEGSGYTPDEVATIYGFPKGVSGAGECIAIIELGGGYRVQDLQSYFKRLNLPVPVISAVSVDTGLNVPGAVNSCDGEVMLDIEVAAAIAPGAKIVVYFTTNTDKGFLDAITTAIHDTKNCPSVISISWGSAEPNWTLQSLNSYNEAFKTAALLGITVCVASGDNGSADAFSDGKAHVDFPASSPYVLACGGTSLVAANNQVVSEVVWHNADGTATGGGVSEIFQLPAYQQNAGVPLSPNNKFTGRGIPDIAGNADMHTGYKVLVDGEDIILGGTSAVAPLYAGLIARINELKGRRVGFINPVLYSTPALCREILQGNNITASNGMGYTAKKGWDACTGLGVLSSL
ncbi:MAG: S53 family peptidase [Flavipsychrobacter sp.]